VHFSEFIKQMQDEATQTFEHEHDSNSRTESGAGEQSIQSISSAFVPSTSVLDSHPCLSGGGILGSCSNALLQIVA
jgi:hypothetical protein